MTAKFTTASKSDASILTCSFKGDFEICSMLCESVDRFVPEVIKHIIYVPESDLKLFQTLANSRRLVLSEEILLPKWFWKIPLPSSHWRRRLLLPRRNFYLTPFSKPVRGWIVQQIMKLAAAAQAETEIVLHVDSDALFVRPLEVSQLFCDGTNARLFRQARVESESHRSWHLAASKLLGLPPDQYHDGDYIDTLVVWRRSVVREMIECIEATGGREWQIMLARTPHFSEYVLYGVFAERVLGLDHAKLAIESTSLCLTRWSKEFSDLDAGFDFAESIGLDQVGICIQSTIALPLAQRRKIYERAISLARRQSRADVAAISHTG